MSEASPRRARGKLAVWCLAIVGLAAVAVTGALVYPELEEWWYGIPVVRTWRGLLQQEPIDLGNGVTVRLGIEARSAPLWSGVLVYCLTEGYSIETGNLEGRLGPLRLTIVEEGGQAQPGTTEQQRLEDLEETSIEDISRSPLLFAQSIPVTSAAARRVEIRSWDGKPLRRTTVRTSPEAFHPWMPLERSTNLQPLRRAAADRVPRAGVVVNAVDGIALPRTEGWWLQLPPAAGAFSKEPDLPLPTLLPRSEVPTVTLRQAGDQLELEAGEELSTWRPTMHFLARFWVNGQPYTPQSRQSVSGMLEGRGMEPPRTKSLRLGLELNLARLRARPGDRIAVQFLYTELGWEHVGPLSALEELRVSNAAEPHRVLLTNRLELTAP